MIPNPDLNFETKINDVAANLIIRALRLLIVSANNDPQISYDDVIGAKALSNSLEEHRLNAHKEVAKNRKEHIDDELIRVMAPSNCPTCEE